jgi:hypothetical protein
MSLAVSDLSPAPKSTEQAQQTTAQPIGLCLDCGYALCGLPTPRCPECGREFDPLDPSTMNMGRPLTPVIAWVLGPLRWPVSLATWAALGFALWTARLPGEQIANSSSIYILITLGVFWLSWPLIRWRFARKYGWPTSLLMQGQRQRILVGLCLLIGAALILKQLPLRAAMAVSQPAMDRMAQDLIASGQPYADDQWVGVYPAKRIKVLPGNTGVRFTVEQDNRAYRSGFVYFPHIDPKKSSWRNKDYRHVSGSWWAWREEG